MFYLYKGEVCITPVGKTVKEYTDLVSYCDKQENLLIDICKYIYFVYHKTDTLGNKNIFNAYPIKERRDIVVGKYDLFKNAKIPGKKSKFTFENIYTEKVCIDFLSFYKQVCYTESERSLDTFREKIVHWREQYSKVTNSAEEDLEYAKALTLAEKHYKEYETKVLLESSTEQETVEGCPLYLFEIPENQKPMHIQLQYGEIKNK